MIFRFGGHEVDVDRAELRGPGGPIHVEPKVLALLALLAENRHRVVTRDEMIEVVWGGLVVSDAAIATVIKLARKAVDDDGDRQAVIATVRGRGLRFVADVRVAAAPARPSQDAPVAPPDGPPTLAVLPFRPLVADPKLRTVCEAVPAEIISTLSRLRWIRVVARDSTFRLGDSADSATVLGLLGAGYKLSGLVASTGAALSVTLDLVDTRKDLVIWSDRIDGTWGDLPELRHQIAQAVSSALDLQVPANEAAAARGRPVSSLTAWQSYHLGLSHLYRFTRTDNAVASELLARATELDPFFCAAFAARSFASFQDAFLGYATDRAGAVESARRHADRAMEIDPLDPLANHAFGRSFLLRGEADDASFWIEKSVDLSPSFAKAHYSLGFSDVLGGRYERSLGEFAMARGLSPLDPLMGPIHANRGLSLLALGRLTEAADATAAGARVASNHAVLQLIAASVAATNGLQEDAQRWAARAKEKRPDASVAFLLAALPFKDRGLRDRVADGLRRAGFPET